MQRVKVSQAGNHIEMTPLGFEPRGPLEKVTDPRKARKLLCRKVWPASSHVITNRMARGLDGRARPEPLQIAVTIGLLGTRRA